MKKCFTLSTKILGSTTVFNIDNNKKCFFEAANQHIMNPFHISEVV